MNQFSKRLSDLSIHPRYLFVYIAIGVLIVFSVPVLRAVPILFSGFLAGLSLVGTAVFVRYGFLVVREHCSECNGVTGLGAVWCTSHQGLQTRFTHPIIQLVLLVGLTYVVGAVLGVTYNVLDIVRPLDGNLYDAVSGPVFGFFRARVGIYEMMAAVPIPVAIGTVLRAIARIVLSR